VFATYSQNYLGGNHVVPGSIVQLAIRVCRMHGEEREHEDIDQDESLLRIPEQSWNDLISHYSKLVQWVSSFCNQTFIAEVVILIHITELRKAAYPVY